MCEESSFKRRYHEILCAYITDPDERHLTAAADLGREILYASVHTEEIGEIHHEAIMKLAQEHPDLSLQACSPRISTPLIELLMAYGLEFRRHAEERELVQKKLKAYSEQLEAMVEERTMELRERQLELRRLVEVLQVKDNAIVTSLSAIAILDLEGKVTFVNRSFLKTWGYDEETEVFDRRIGEFIREQAKADQVMATLLKEGQWLGELAATKKDGRTFDAQVAANLVTDRAGESIGMMASFLDITERKAMQEKLLNAEKLATLGKLAAGVGHELRNPLGAIKNASYFLNMALPDVEPEVKEVLEILQREVATSEQIIGSLLGYARPKPPSVLRLRVNDLIKEALSRVSIPKNVEVVSALDEGLPIVPADPIQLGMALRNIILNAVQAMTEGGRLTITSSAVPVEPGGVMVSISDSGVGISEEHLPLLFEPLFTTKAKGIGLGLAIAKTMIEVNEGTIEVESIEGSGSTFKVVFPFL